MKKDEKVAAIEAILAAKEENDEYSPLFGSEPETELATGIKGDIITRPYNGRVYYALKIKEGNLEVDVNIMSGKQDQKVFNVGNFVALRDYESASGNTKYERGKTKRTFAY